MTRVFAFWGRETDAIFGNRENMEALAENVTIRLPNGATLEESMTFEVVKSV